MIAIATALMLAATPAAESESESFPPRVFGEECSLLADCGAGLTCAFSVCRYSCAADQDCWSGRCLPDGGGGTACTEETGARPPPPRKPAVTWSKQGWQTLRFGMGPGDVLAAVGVDVSCDPIRGEGVEDSACEPWPEQVAGAAPRVSLRYIGGELASIGLHVQSPEGDAPEDQEARSIWLSNIRKAMTGKYGKPSADSARSQGSSLGTMISIWELRGLRVFLAVSTESATIRYNDPARTARIERARQEAAEAKAKVDPAGL